MNNEEDILLRIEAEKIIKKVMKNFNTPGEQYLASYVYLIHRTVQIIEEMLRSQEIVNKKLNRSLNETNKLLKKLNEEFDKIRKSQQNLEAYFHMIVRKEGGECQSAEE